VVRFVGWLLESLLDFVTHVREKLQSLLGEKVKEELVPERIESSPEFRETIEAVGRRMYELATQPIRELEEKHSPISPEEGRTVAWTLGGAGTVGWVFGTVGSAVGEALSLGQLESISDWLKEAWTRIGLAAMMAAGIMTPYRVGVARPYEYWCLHRFRPILLNISQLRELRGHGFIDSDRFKEIMRYTGLSDEDIDLLERLTWTVPRERILAGWLRNRSIDQDFFKEVMRWFGYEDRFIEAWIRDAWLPLTRYETRIVWEIIGLPDEFLREALSRRGYREEDIEKMIAYIKGFTARGERMAAGRILLRGFREGFYSEEVLLGKLKELGLRNEIIEALVLRAKVEYEIDLLSEKWKTLQTGYAKQRLTLEQFKNEAFKLGIVEERVNSAIELIEMRKKLVEG